MSSLKMKQPTGLKNAGSASLESMLLSATRDRLQSKNRAKGFYNRSNHGAPLGTKTERVISAEIAVFA
jgi:hypothetical protein